MLQHTRKRVKIQRDRHICGEKHEDLIPEMPPLIPLTSTDKLKMNILDKIKLVASMEHALLREQKKLDILWEERRKRIIKGQNSVEIKQIELEKVIKHTREVNQFRQFWGFYESFEEDRDGKGEDEQNPVSIEDLVVDEIQKYRARKKI